MQVYGYYLAKALRFKQNLHWNSTVTLKLAYNADSFNPDYA